MLKYGPACLSTMGAVRLAYVIFHRRHPEVLAALAASLEG
jgi:hypothetical protein